MSCVLQTCKRNRANPDVCYGQVEMDPDEGAMLEFGYDTRGSDITVPPMWMDEKVPGKLVPDVVPNIDGLWVLSRPLAEWMASRAGMPSTTHPIQLLDHRKKPVAKELVVLNICGWVDCIDRALTVAEIEEPDDWVPCAPDDDPRVDTDWDRFPENEMNYLEKFHVISRLIPSGVNIFRPKSFSRMLIWRKELAEEAVAAGFTGLVFHDEGDDLGMLIT